MLWGEPSSATVSANVNLGELRLTFSESETSSTSRVSPSRFSGDLKLTWKLPVSFLR